MTKSHAGTRVIVTAGAGGIGKAIAARKIAGNDNPADLLTKAPNRKRMQMHMRNFGLNAGYVKAAAHDFSEVSVIGFRAHGKGHKPK